MASRKVLFIAAAAMAVVVVGALLPANASAAKVYRIGDDHGWSLGVDYNAWARDRVFNVGDMFEFVFPVGSHNVVIVDSTSYLACRAPRNAVTLNDSIARWTFTDPGQYFFICGFEGHCQSGMRLAVNVQ